MSLPNMAAQVRSLALLCGPIEETLKAGLLGLLRPVHDFLALQEPVQVFVVRSQVGGRQGSQIIDRAAGEIT